MQGKYGYFHTYYTSRIPLDPFCQLVSILLKYSVLSMTTVTRPLSAGKMMMLLSCLNHLSACYSSFVKLLSRMGGFHVTLRSQCWWSNRKEFFINAIVGPSQRGRFTLFHNSLEIACNPRIEAY